MYSPIKDFVIFRFKILNWRVQDGQFSPGINYHLSCIKEFCNITKLSCCWNFCCCFVLFLFFLLFFFDLAYFVVFVFGLIHETDNVKFVKYLYHNTTSYNIHFICVFGGEIERKKKQKDIMYGIKTFQFKYTFNESIFYIQFGKNLDNQHLAF